MSIDQMTLQLTCNKHEDYTTKNVYFGAVLLNIQKHYGAAINEYLILLISDSKGWEWHLVRHALNLMLDNALDGIACPILLRFSMKKWNVVI